MRDDDVIIDPRMVRMRRNAIGVPVPAFPQHIWARHIDDNKQTPVKDVPEKERTPNHTSTKSSFPFLQDEEINYLIVGR